MRTLAVLLLLAGTGYAQDRPATKYVTEKDTPYRTGDGVTASMREQCKLDVYHPQGATGFPTVVWFHGGGLTEGKKAIPPGLANKGLAVIAANYRLSPSVTAPAYIEDAAAAVAWTFSNGDRSGGSRTHVYVAGHSAGGSLTAMVGLGAALDRCEALLGPAICGACYEVPAAMRDEVDAALPGSATRTRRGTPGLDLHAGLRKRLAALGVARVGVDPRCTAEDPDLYSYRRAHRPGGPNRTGRLAAVTWLDPTP